MESSSFSARLAVPRGISRLLAVPRAGWRWIPLNLDGFLFSADYQSGKKAEITSRIAANFVGREKDHALFDLELDKVIRALRTGEGGREKPPPARL
jgi:hypothetical protein